ncbi:MAG: rhodanese-like domain-containing protein [Gemmatimonadota bacterium]
MAAPSISSNLVAESIASATTAESHFRHLLSVETDCADVHHLLERNNPGFALLDVRSPELFARGHVPGSINLPHRKITEAALAGFSADVVFVVYCAGPHCNGADRAALRLAQLGRPVKKMIGGITGWLDEGFGLAAAAES